jgi:hypothetical protein
VVLLWERRQDACRAGDSSQHSVAGFGQVLARDRSEEKVCRRRAILRKREGGVGVVYLTHVIANQSATCATFSAGVWGRRESSPGPRSVNGPGPVVTPGALP